MQTPAPRLWHLPQLADPATVKRLAAMHKAHIEKPGFDGGAAQEREIEIKTAEITAMFHKSQKTIQTVNRKVGSSPTPQQRTMGKNVVASLAKDLQVCRCAAFRQAWCTAVLRAWFRFPGPLWLTPPLRCHTGHVPVVSKIAVGLPQP